MQNKFGHFTDCLLEDNCVVLQRNLKLLEVLAHRPEVYLEVVHLADDYRHLFKLKLFFSLRFYHFFHGIVIECTDFGHLRISWLI